MSIMLFVYVMRYVSQEDLVSWGSDSPEAAEIPKRVPQTANEFLRDNGTSWLIQIRIGRGLVETLLWRVIWIHQ